MKKSLILYFLLCLLISCDNPAGSNSEFDTEYDPATSIGGETADETAPTTPTSLVVTNSATLTTSPTFSWTGSLDLGGVTGYEAGIGTTAASANFSAYTSIGNVLTYSYTGLSLTAGQAYFFFVRAVDAAGNKSLPLISSSWSPGLKLQSGAYLYSDDTYAANCREYFDSVQYNNEGNALYHIDPDGIGGNASFIVNCNMTLTSGGWTRLFFHDTSSGAFVNKTQAGFLNQSDPNNSDKYSIVSLVDSIKSSATFEFYVNWPSVDNCNPSYVHWTQTSDPFTTNESVSGFNLIGGNNGSGFNGLCVSSQGATLLDGNCGSGNWWHAIGQVSLFGGAIPACGSTESQVELFIR